MMSDTLKHWFGMTNDGQQGIGRLNHHAVISYAFETPLAIVGSTAFAAKATIGQNQSIGCPQIHQRQKVLVGPIHGHPMPAH